MDKFYQLGPVTLCMRNWPRDYRWPFALWRLDAYEVPGDAFQLMAEYDPAFAPEEIGQWQLIEASVAAKRMELCLPDGMLLWKQQQSDGGELKFALAPNCDRVVLMQDTTRTFGMAALEALTFFIFPMLLRHNILTFHSVLLEYKGQGILVAAPSGVGKTTHARLWRDTKDALILNGDRSPCYEENGQWFAFGTPWCGTSGENINRRVPVKAMVLLKQDTQNRLVTLQPLEQLNQLLGLVACPAGWQERLLSLMDDFLKTVPVVGLACTPDREAVEVLQAYLEKL